MRSRVAAGLACSCQGHTAAPKAACSVTALLGLAVTEPQCGHNVFRSKTTVRREGNYFVINGVKAVTSGIDMVERVLVFGRDPDRGSGEGPSFTTVLVDPNSAVAEELPMRFREGARQYQLTFNDVIARLRRSSAPRDNACSCSRQPLTSSGC